MDKLIKKSIYILVATIILFSFTLQANVLHVSAYEDVPNAGVFINGKIVDGINPIKINGAYYLPLIYIAKILGYNDIRFESKTKTYEITDGSAIIRVTMGGNRARKSNEYINVESPRWINETAYMSLAATSALFNSFIYFKPENGSVQIERPATKYRIQKGDNLWFIAKSHHTTVGALKRENNLTSNVIHPGHILKLPTRDLGKELEPIKEKLPVKSPQTNLTKLRNNIIVEAQKYLGAKYKFGATLNEAPSLFDCSSYTQYVFSKNGIQLPRTSRDQAAIGTAVSSLVKGDLLFFTTNDLYTDGRVGHVGIYMGNGDMIHASTSKGVSVVTNFMNNSYWSKNYLFAKKIIK